jgi:hypothetical protein
MQPPYLLNAEAALKACTRGELESLALGFARSHAIACELVGEEKPDHASLRETERRIEHLDSEALIAMLAPLAAVAAMVKPGAA